MFADVVGYSRMMASNEERTLELLKDFENICSPIISKHDGEIIKKVGDELFCEFSSAKQAIDCALAIQKAIQPYNDSRPKDFKLQVRVGIHIGDIVLRDGDIFGDGVNIASRIQPFASPSGICISSAVKEAVSSHPNYNIISEGQQELKNILEKHSLYRVETGYEIVDENRKIDKPKVEKKNKWTIGLLIFIGLMLLLFITDSHINIGERWIIDVTHSKGKKILTPAKYEQLTFTGNAELIDITKDGAYIAFSSDNNIFVQDIASGNTLKLLEDFISWGGRFTPDGMEILISGKDSMNNNVVLLVPRLGRNVRTINIPWWTRYTWSPDGKKIAYTNTAWKQIRILDLISNQVIDSIDTNEDFEFMGSLDWSPNGKFLSFATITDPNYTIFTISVDDKSENKIIREINGISGITWSPVGDALYYLLTEGMTHSIKKIKIDPMNGKPIGDSYDVLSGLSLPQWGGRLGLDISNSGDFIFTERQAHSNIWSLITDQKQDSLYVVEEKKLTNGTYDIEALEISPNGEQIAYIITTGSRSNIYTIPITGGESKQITYLKSYCTNLAWSLDGNKIVFGVIEDGNNHLKIVDLKTGAIKNLEGVSPSISFSLSWYPNDKIIYQKKGNRNFYVLDPINGIKTELITVDSVGWMFQPRTSPDLDKIAVVWNREPQAGLYSILTKDTRNDSNAINLTQKWDTPIGWSKDSENIYAIRRDTIIVIQYDTGIITNYLKISSGNFTFEDVNSQGSSISPDEKTFIFSIIENEQFDIWRVTNFDPEFN